MCFFPNYSIQSIVYSDILTAFTPREIIQSIASLVRTIFFSKEDKKFDAQSELVQNSIDVTNGPNNNLLMIKPDFFIDKKDIIKLCGGAEQALIYGYEDCHYKEINKCLNTDKNSPLKKSLDYNIGDKNIEKQVITSDNRIIEQINISEKRRHKINANSNSSHKAGLINIVLENCKRESEGLSLIPILFFVKLQKKNGNNMDWFTAENICNVNLNKFTPRELRRCYKVCCEIENEQIKTIASKTIKFVLEKEVGGNLYELKEIPPFWKDKDWGSKWSEMICNKSTTKQIDYKKYFWRKELIARLENKEIFDVEKKKYYLVRLMKKLFNQQQKSDSWIPEKNEFYRWLLIQKGLEPEVQEILSTDNEFNILYDAIISELMT